MALPILIAIIFASVADWLEHFLMGREPSRDEKEDTRACRWQRPIEAASRGEWCTLSSHRRDQKSV